MGMGILRIFGFVATWAGRFKGAAYIIGLLGFGVMFWSNLWQSILTINPFVLGLSVIAFGVLIYLLVETATNWYPKHIAADRYFNLPRQIRLSFQEISNSISGNDHVPYNQVLQSLLKALWFGEFENNNGDSRVKVIRAIGVQYPNGEEPRPTNGHGNPLNPDEVPQDDVSRSSLLYVWEPVDGINVPTRQEIRESAWKDIKERINFHRLANLPVNRYSDVYRTAFIEPLLITQKDFSRWLMRYVTGNYE